VLSTKRAAPRMRRRSGENLVEPRSPTAPNSPAQRPPTMRICGGEFYGCKDSPASGVDISAVQIHRGMCRLARYSPCPCFSFDWAPSELPKPCEVPGNHHGVITVARPRFVGGGHSLSRSLPSTGLTALCSTRWTRCFLNG
jgi:hypothetical protein